MKTLFCKYILVFSFIIIGVAQEKYDVLYLKNGNILKGVIVENVYGEYIRIELIGGSLMTVKYSIIDNMVKASATKESIDPPHNFNSPEMQSTDDNKLNQSKIINQFPQFQKGVYSISGGISYSKSNSETDISSSKSTEFSVSPGYSTFIANGLSLGIGILYNYSTYEELTSNVV